MAQEMTISGPDDLVAALPHLLGFAPHEALVLVPLMPGLPVVRVDLPRSEADRDDVAVKVAGPVFRHAREAGGHAAMAIVCVSEDRRSAELAATSMTSRLGSQVDFPLKVWANESTWTDLASGRSGPRSPEAESRYAAQMVAAGRPVPLARREDLAASLFGDPSRLEAALAEVREQGRASTPEIEGRWVGQRIDRFVRDENSLSDVDAARVLVGVHDRSIRNEVWTGISKTEVHTHRALWNDLTRRAPDEVRAPAAALAGFTAWLAGDGAGAWFALDRIPDTDRDYRLAGLVAGLLETAVHPREWNQIQAQLILRPLDELPAAGSLESPRTRERPVEPPPSGGPSLGQTNPGRSR